MPTHSENRVLPWTADEMYALVADVARYPEFLPWTAAARIRSRKPGADGSFSWEKTDLAAKLAKAAGLK